MWPPEVVAACPFKAVEALLPEPRNRAIRRAPDLFAPQRGNSAGFDLTEAGVLAAIEAARTPATPEGAAPLIAGSVAGTKPAPVVNPATGEVVGEVAEATGADVETALGAAKVWDADGAERARVLLRAADLYEADFGPIFALLAREAGKTLADAVSELREAADFLRYYGAQAAGLTRPPWAGSSASARGTFRWRSLPARSRRPWPQATPCWPSPPNRRP